ncbi:tetratricopeptide repeat protein [Tenacibaculum sp. M341]|nr:tetratricopeptide repeat protein [Tenacibaculum sp. M341]
MRNRILIIIFLVFSVFSYSQSTTFALAENYFRNNEYEKAAEFYKQLVQKSPYNTTYLKKLVSCYQEMNRFDFAESLLTDKLSKRKNLSFLNVLLGYNYERQQKTDLAEKYYRKAIESIKDKSGYGSIIASMFKDYSKLDLAIEAYGEASKQNENVNYGFQIAQIYGEKGDFNLMFESYLNYLDTNENYLNTVKRYTARYVTDDGEDPNNILFKKALLRKSASNPKDVWNDLLSWLFIKQKDYGKAFIQKKALYQRNSESLFQIHELGQIAFDDNEFESAKKCFDYVIENTDHDGDKFHAILMNLQIAVKTNDPETEQKFQQTFTEYGIDRGTFAIQVLYADYLTFNKNLPEKAKNTLEKALKFSVNKYQKAEAQLKLADVLVYQNTFNKALIYFSQVQTRFKNHELGQKARFKVAQTSYFKSDFKWAKAQLKVLKGSATQLIANDAADLFLTISDNQPQDSIPSGLKLYAKADLLAYQNKDTAAISILNTILNKYKGQPIEDEALFKQAELFSKSKKYDKAITNYLSIIEIDDQGILVDDAYYLMAQLYENKLDDVEKAKEYYQKIVFNYPSSIYLVDARKRYRKLRGDTI